MIIQDQDGKQDIGLVEHGNINLVVLNNLDHIIKKNLKNLLVEVEITPSNTALENVCSTKKICDEQGEITFGQLRELVESGKIQRIATHVGEGGYKAILRLIPWFIPQLVLLGFGATWIRVINKLFRPTLEETTSYKTWWGKTILKVFDLVEGELNANDPLSKIFFISDGLMTMLDDKYKVEFARYIAEVASEQPDTRVVPEYFVENELRHWVNKKFFLDSSLSPKKGNDDNFDIKLTESFTKKIILEKVKNASFIRKMVQDLITIYKKEDEGEFYLPEDMGNDELEYTLPNSKIALEFMLEPSETVDDYLANANFYRKDDIIVIKVVYNPNKKNKIIYNLIGELNELIAHELRHQYQRDQGLYGMDILDDESEDEEEKGIEYYSKPEEIDAQVDGFKRMRDITRKPFEELVRNWFRTHRDIHLMNLDDENKVINMILFHYQNS